MFWIVVAVIVLAVIAAISSAAKKTEEAQKRQEFNQQAESRVTAYADYLKRTQATPAIAGMTENEIRDFISRHIREYATEHKGLTVLVTLIVVIGFVVGAILSATNNALTPLVGLTVAAGGLAKFIYDRVSKNLRTKYERLGLDVERLKIET